MEPAFTVTGHDAHCRRRLEIQSIFERADPIDVAPQRHRRVVLHVRHLLFDRFEYVGELGAQGIRSTDPDYELLIAPYRLPGVA